MSGHTLPLYEGLSFINQFCCFQVFGIKCPPPEGCVIIQGDVMPVEAKKAIQFECENCGEVQFSEYTLNHGWHVDRAVNEDRIDCEECGHENHVIEEL